MKRFIVSAKMMAAHSLLCNSYLGGEIFLGAEQPETKNRAKRVNIKATFNRWTQMNDNVVQ